MLQESAYIRDLRRKDLAKEVLAEVDRFVPDGDAFVLYGMVVSELKHKVDPHNWKEAVKAVAEVSPDKCEKEVMKRQDTKMILLMNDKIVDGHHFLAKATRGGITSSLQVLDITSARLQTESHLVRRILRSL